MDDVTGHGLDQPWRCRHEVNRKPPEKKEFKFLYPVIDVTGNMGMAQVEVMRGETIMFTDYFPVVKTRTGWKIVGYPFYLHENGARPETPAGEADAVKKVVEDTLVRGLMQDGTKEQVRAGFASVCDVSLYLPEIDVVTKLDIALPLDGEDPAARSRFRSRPPLSRSSALRAMSPRANSRSPSIPDP